MTLLCDGRAPAMTFLRQVRYLGVLFVLLFGSASPLPAQPDADRQRPVATVDGTPITVADFERAYIAALISTGADDTRAARYRHLHTLIDQHLLAAEARRRGLEADAAFQTFIERALRKATGTRFFEMTALDTLPPPADAELRDAFARSRQQVAVRHLFYRDPAQAQAAYERLRRGRDFLDEAQSAFGLAAFDSSAGYLGPIRYFSVDDAFAEVAFSLGVGDFSAPFRSRYGYHIVRVEDKVIAPILTESAYQARKAGIASQLRQRRRRLAGDAFIRRFMAERRVEVQPQGIAALARAIDDLAHDAAPQPVAVLQGNETAGIDPGALRAALTSETVLATYTLGEQPYTFTAGDYAFWLPDLPFQEAQDRTAASVGRALRNEVLARAGAARGLAADSLVQREVQEQARAYLSAALLEQVRHDPPTSIDAAFLEEAYARLGMETPADSVQQARAHEQLAPLYAEFLLLKQLRAAASIQINTSLFEQLLADSSL